ncbi:hypothetical protein SHELI_v1c04750 [Spiroplasma helicoides]|uniref:Uncharacterized protein n=1 Tax=Spiroplasma helicoides TaxID=216938 RepID=A0A1B3SKI0_9MOLU|nr:hypothetical protein [Spiroplasma helicoides]AOG60426.1 hypothetical protein SHELI_v1c04750 [Spiroplasma helicoides]
MTKSPYEYLSEKDLEVWNKSKDCNCGEQDCKEKHKLCALCNHRVLFEAYIECEDDDEINWNIDHIIPKIRFEELMHIATTRGIHDIDDLKNLQLTHVHCNIIKANIFNNNYENGFGLIINQNYK